VPGPRFRSVVRNVNDNEELMGHEEPRFEDLTETTGIPVTAEGASMMLTRYSYAAGLSAGRTVLEIGCGAGQGLGMLGSAGRGVVGGDYSWPLLRSARAHYGDRFPLALLSAEALPFRGSSFDLVLCFEASYYVRDAQRAFDEIRRVLTPGGQAVFVNANPERPDFIRSPHSVHYHSSDEFRSALASRGFDVVVEGAFPVDATDDRVTIKSRLVGFALGLARRVLETSGLTPKTLRGRARIKRLLNRHLIEVPAEVAPGFAVTAARAPVAAGPVRNYKVIYVTATVPS
jgi:SAM-dependent methyltransferase